ncbi:MAG: amidohydrolase [Candidatus Bathyarchaeia archaeon]
MEKGWVDLMANIIIKDGTIITLDKNRRILRNGCLVIEGNRIIEVLSGKELTSKYSSDIEIDAKGKVVLPGLINTHTHMFQDLLRGPGDDRELMTWLSEMLYPVAKELSVSDVLAGAYLGCVEMIKTGTTCVLDNHHVNTGEEAIESVIKAMKETGIRGMVARGIKERTKRCEIWKIPDYLFQFTPEEEVKITEKLMKKWNNDPGKMVKVCPGPTAIFNCGPKLFLELKRLSDEYGVPIHTHVAESPEEVKSTLEDYGKREIEFLDDVGVLNDRFHVVHGVWINEREIELMAISGAHHIHCPVSNMYLASGVAPIRKLIEKGVNVALATDGPASNNNQDMFGVMKATALLQKVSTLDPTSITCEQVLEMATINGAKALGLENEIGSIEVGKKADIIIVDLNKPHSAPVHRPVSSIVYSALGSDVETVIVDGKIIMENYEIKTVDEKKIMSDAEKAAKNLAIKTGFESMLKERK